MLICEIKEHFLIMKQMEAQVNGRLLLYAADKVEKKKKTKVKFSERELTEGLELERLRLSAGFKVPPTQTRPISYDCPFWGKSKGFFLFFW